MLRIRNAPDTPEDCCSQVHIPVSAPQPPIRNSATDFYHTRVTKRMKFSSRKIFFRYRTISHRSFSLTRQFFSYLIRFLWQHEIFVAGTDRGLPAVVLDRPNTQCFSRTLLTNGANLGGVQGRRPISVDGLLPDVESTGSHRLKGKRGGTSLPPEDVRYLRAGRPLESCRRVLFFDEGSKGGPVT